MNKQFSQSPLAFEDEDIKRGGEKHKVCLFRFHLSVSVRFSGELRRLKTIGTMCLKCPVRPVRSGQMGSSLRVGAPVSGFKGTPKGKPKPFFRGSPNKRHHEGKMGFK